jgi:hypothetical protein
MSSLLDRISELEQQLAVLRAEAEKEEKENKSTNKRWRAEKRGTYWFVDGDGIPKWWHEYSRDIDGFYYDTHNYFQTEDEARRYAKVLEVERQLKRFADEHNDKIDWNDGNSVKYYLYYNHSAQSIFIAIVSVLQYARVIYFSSEEIAEQAIKTIGEEEIKEYLTYEW